MLLWLWDASGPGQFHGVTDDESRARRAAETCLTGGLASVATVERAYFAMDGWGMHDTYRRTGMAWIARASAQRVRWVPVGAERAS